MLNASKHEARPKISSPNPLRRIRRAVEDYDFDRLEVEAQQCVKLTSTNRPFGLIIKLSQTVFEEEAELARQGPVKETPFLHSVVRLAVELVMPANFCCRARARRVDPHNRAARKRASFQFPVIKPRGSHPFPSRTRKLSLAGPMILHGQLCGNVGRRRD